MNSKIEKFLASKNKLPSEKQVLRYLPTTVGLLLLMKEATVCGHP